jgi:hypothetical protein
MTMAAGVVLPRVGIVLVRRPGCASEVFCAPHEVRYWALSRWSPRSRRHGSYRDLNKSSKNRSITSSAQASNEGAATVRHSSRARSGEGSSVNFLRSENGNCGIGNKPGFPLR